MKARLYSRQAEWALTELISPGLSCRTLLHQASVSSTPGGISLTISLQGSLWLSEPEVNNRTNPRVLMTIVERLDPAMHYDTLVEQVMARVGWVDEEEHEEEESDTSEHAIKQAPPSNYRRRP